jgi:hypothetical protein
MNSIIKAPHCGRGIIAVRESRLFRPPYRIFDWHHGEADLCRKTLSMGEKAYFQYLQVK